ncbi:MULTISPECIES: DUF6163 family protein [Stappiaceae]|uniref:Uncharacterized protein n=1 Tax=Roseibium polysiphoniae TaxID=2571221 RepID=A0A944GRY1_9HYPH|nr:MULTISPECIES: DUF6163 family protein [Stappiaceae]MBD8875071.1 hypothetical protein [Roseibium polysiphoniae]MBS8258966.1 hypothetical protein [Roseibium polysiphoniae]
MITSFQDLIKTRPPWSTVLIWYLRGIALLLVGGGIIHWARIVGFVPWRGLWFWDMPIEWQAATVFFAVLDLVAATGLWLAVSWGTVMWLFRAMSQIVMHSLFSDIYGRRPYEISFYILTIAIYLLLMYLMERENRTN